MAMKTVLRTVMVGGVITLAALGYFLFSNPFSQGYSVSLLLFSAAAINISLLYFVLKFLFVDQAEFFRSLVEKIPGVHLSTPVPKHLIPEGAKNALQVQQPISISHADVAFNQTGMLPLSDDEYPSIDSIDAELAAIMQDEPFTLATAQLDLPVAKTKPTGTTPSGTVPSGTAPSGTTSPNDLSIGKQTHKANLGMDVSASFSAQGQKSTQPNKQQQLHRFFSICRLLKQMNEEVAVWTEGELATLANTMLTPRSKDKDMVALLLPQRVARITLNKTFEYEFHGQVLRSIILATGENLPISFVHSSKVDVTGQCAVNFEYNGKPVSWRFIEPSNVVSKRFLKNALEWIAQRAGGKFYDVSDNDIICSFVFVSNDIANQLSKSPARIRA